MGFAEFRDKFVGTQAYEYVVPYLESFHKKNFVPSVKLIECPADRNLPELCHR
jgi:hypothetical protein